MTRRIDMLLIYIMVLSIVVTFMLILVFRTFIFVLFLFLPLGRLLTRRRAGGSRI
jgi:hypothetical protein